MGQLEPATCSASSGLHLQESGKQSSIMPKVFLFCDEQWEPKSNTLIYSWPVQR